MNTIKRLVKARALRQGLLGGHPFWRVVWIGQFAYKQFAKVSKGGDPPIAFDEPLKEGEVWAVVHEPEKTRKGRGLGRKFLIGPKRKKSRVSTLTGLALGVAGEKILAAPSPERINQILGEQVFDPTPPTKAQQRAAKKSAKLEAAQAKDDARHAARVAKAAKRQDAADAKAAASMAASEARAAKKRAAKAKKAAKAAAKAERSAEKRAVRKWTSRSSKAARGSVVISTDDGADVVIDDVVIVTPDTD